MSRAKHAFDVYPGAMQVDCNRDPMSFLKTNQLFADTLVHSEHALNLALEIVGHVSKSINIISVFKIQKVTFMAGRVNQF